MRKPGQFRAGHKVRHRNSPHSRVETIRAWAPVSIGEVVVMP